MSSCCVCWSRSTSSGSRLTASGSGTRAHLKGMFPNLPAQSGWGKHVRQSTGLLSTVITELARDTPSFGEITRLVDSTPLPCGKSRETVKRSDLAGHAGYG